MSTFNYEGNDSLGHGSFHLTFTVSLRLGLLDTDGDTHDNSSGEL